VWKHNERTGWFRHKINYVLRSENYFVFRMLSLKIHRNVNLIGNDGVIVLKFVDTCRIVFPIDEALKPKNTRFVINIHNINMSRHSIKILLCKCKEEGLIVSVFCNLGWLKLRKTIINVSVLVSWDGCNLNVIFSSPQSPKVL
jgi:hypothetical protein